MRLSYTALSDFKTCPLKFKLAQIDKIKTPRSKDAIFGTLLHDCLQLAFDPRRALPATEEEILNYFKNKWDREVYQGNEAEESMAFSSGVAILKDFFARNNPAEAKIVDLEKSFTIPVALGQQEHQITGKIDRIDKLPDDSFEIIDYKTTKKMPSQQLVDNNLQLTVYHLGLVQLWPKIEEENRPVKVSLYFLKHDEKLSTQKTRDDLKEARLRLKEELAAIEKYQAQNNWQPTPNALCDWCGFKHLCPMFRHQFSPVPLPDSDKIKDVIGQFFQLKEEAKKLKIKEVEFKQLIDRFLEANSLERVFGEEGFITRRKIPFYSFDPAKIKDVMEPLGRFLEVIKIDSAKLKKAALTLPAPARQAIAEAKKLERESKTFQLTKKKS